MLLESGDLIPVKRAAADIPWTRRKTQVLEFLHRGPVEFSTYVYDTNVGDIAPISTYFNPHHWTVDDLNHKFGLKQSHHTPREISMRSSPSTIGDGDDVKSRSLQPKLFIYPTEEEMAQMTAQESGSSPCSGLTLLTHLESVSNCECCSNDDWPHGPTIVRPKARRASSVQKQPDSPDSPGSPGRKMWLPVHFEDMDSVFSKRSSVSPTGSLDPIGPPKRQKLANTSPTSFESSWPKFEKLQPSSENSLKTSYFSILTEDSPWSPWLSVCTPENESKPDKQAEQNDGLVSSLRKIAQQNNVFFS